MGTCTDDVSLVAFMEDLRKSTNKHLLRSLYLNPLEDFNSTLARAKNYMLVDEVLDSSEGEDREPLKKNTKM